MSYNFSLITERLLINPLSASDNQFILELLNTDGWIKFIGNRHIHSLEDATTYIQKVVSTEHLVYWTVKIKEGEKPIGIITFIKRDYLDHQDIGFAFLPAFSKKGYAFEATTAVLQKLNLEYNLSYILATTKPENLASITLLKKIGLVFQKELEVGNEMLNVYEASLSK